MVVAIAIRRATPRASNGIGEMTRVWGIAALLLAIGAFESLAQEPNWPALARQDLQAIHDVVEADHPGPEIDPLFRARLEDGLDGAMASADRVADLTQYLYLLIEYANGLPDHHLAVWGNHQHPHWTAASRPETFGPGFVASYRGDAIVVSAMLGVGVPPLGAELVGCGDHDADWLLHRNALRFQGDGALPADRVSGAPLMFLDQGQLDMVRPARCRFLVDGGEQAFDLAWTPARMGWLQPLLAAAAFGNPPQIGGRWVADDLLWISLPILAPSGAGVEAVEELRQMVDAAPADADIVFDLRGNGGGNSFLARGFAVALYGEPLVAWGEGQLYSGIPDAMRASPANREHFQSFRDALGGSRPDDPGLARYLDTILAALDTAIAAGEPLAHLGEPSEPVRTDPPPSEHYGQVFVIIDGRVFSSALLFVDLLRAIDDVTLVGWPTRAHGLYGEIRQLALPSGWAWMSLSTKAFLSAAPGRRGAIEPDLVWDGEIADTAGLEAWVLSLAQGGE